MKASVYTLLILSIVYILASCADRVIETPAIEEYDDERLAHQTLIAFLEYLHNEQYEDAVKLYGGTYEIMIEQNPDIDPTERPELFHNACTINGAQCREVKSAVLDREVSATEFEFRVEFLNEDETLFVLGPCCGGNETDSPSQESFIFSVIRGSNGKFQVMDMPPYMP